MVNQYKLLKKELGAGLDHLVIQEAIEEIEVVVVVVVVVIGGLSTRN